jgi:phosphoribosyl 1,2-cyclic phosphodiesterase
MSPDAANSNPSVAVIVPAPPALRVRCWGGRGSIPSPGPSTAAFGGNTSCLEVRVGERRLIFDAGTGIRVLGRDILQDGTNCQADLFLSHFHWDHIQGIPFFGPLYDPATHLRIHGARQGEVDIQTLFAGQMGPIYFPIPFEALAATLEFSHLDGKPWRADGIEVAAIRVRHPGHTYGYRISVGGARVAYIPDNELVGSSYAVDGPEWYDELIAFLKGVDVLYHDAMFTDTEYQSRIGWGHSTFAQAVRLAEDAGVRRLYFFHHAPERTDAELLEILDEFRADLGRRGSALELGAASEGEELVVREVRP